MEDPYTTMINTILPRLVERFENKAADYGEVFRELGLGGQYSDMHRKMHKLKKAMWDREMLKGEQPEEILSDLFGNILISLYLYGPTKASPWTASAQPSSGQDTGPQGPVPQSVEAKGRAGQQAADAIRKLASS